MGNIKKLLSACELPPRDITPNGVWGDVCENIHLHLKNYRWEFSPKEYSQFISHLNQIQVSVDKIITDYKWKPNDPNFLVQATLNCNLPADSDYHPDRFTIEWGKDNTVHIHYRDFRLHISIEEFKRITDSFIEARKQYDGFKEFPYKNVERRTRTRVGIDDIQPYDEGHKPLEKLDEGHSRGVEYCKELIRQGKKIRPILVDPTGQRIDGFKRWVAQKEMGIKEIDIIIDPFFSVTIGKDKKFFLAGGQYNMPMEDDGRDVNDDLMIICPICKERRVIAVPIKDSGYAFCNRCQAFFTEWKNMEQSLYNDSYLRRYTDYEKNFHYYDYSWKTFLPKIDSSTGNKRNGFLDVGFIYPQLLDNARQDGFVRTTGVDINKACKDVTKGHELYIGDFETADIKEQYDVIWASHVLEHFKNPLNALEKIYHLTARGGVVFLAAPDPDSINPRNLAGWGHWKIDEHHVIFTMDKVVEELKKLGYEIVYAKHNEDNRFICVGDYHILAKKDNKNG